MTDKLSIAPQPYRILSILRTDSPPGAEGSNWHHYVIAQGTRMIHGYRQGSLEAVTTAVQENVAKLNERQLGKHSGISRAATKKK